MRKATNKMVVGWRGLVLTLFVAIISAVSSASEPIDRLIDVAVGRFAWRAVSGEIVVVGVDERTLSDSRYPEYNRIDQANTLKAIDAAGAQRIFLDFEYDRNDNYGGLDALSQTIQSIGEKMVLGVASRNSFGDSGVRHILPPKSFGNKGKLASIAWNYEFWQVWDVPIMYQAGETLFPSFAAVLANVRTNTPKVVRIDFSYRPETISHFSAADVLQGKVGKAELAGKDVIFGPTALSSRDFHNLPGHDMVAGPFIHLIAGETLRRGGGYNLGWIPPLLAAIASLTPFVLFRKVQRFLLASLAVSIVFVVAKFAMAQFLVHFSIGPALIYISMLAMAVTRFRRHVSAQRLNPVSGLPNFAALRSYPQLTSDSIVVVKLTDFDDLNSYLSTEEAHELIAQVARRLQIAAQGKPLHHDSDGSFAWLVSYSHSTSIEDQLAGVAALFNNPIALNNRRIDITLAFGIDDDVDARLVQRLSSARSAADKAVQKRSLWERSSRSGIEDASWKLSFQSQLEEGMADGDIWVAFQPQYHIGTGAMVGVEALARWTHPSRGNIPPDQFILHAEKTQNIYRLTLFVMDKAIHSAAQLLQRGHNIQMSVNLSATLLNHLELSSSIHMILKAHNLPASNLTIEITESAQFNDSARAFQTLSELKQSGIRLSIDDYGTGQSNLAYLTQIEAHEIKIDKRFVMTMRESQRNFEIVKSTIDLAHRLGATAVAEGIEDAATLSLLQKLKCDIAQGYHLGKPQLFFEVVAELDDSKHSKSA